MSSLCSFPPVWSFPRVSPCDAGRLVAVHIASCFVYHQERTLCVAVLQVYQDEAWAGVGLWWDSFILHVLTVPTSRGHCSAVREMLPLTASDFDGVFSFFMVSQGVDVVV